MIDKKNIVVDNHNQYINSNYLSLFIYSSSNLVSIKSNLNIIPRGY